MFSPIRRSSLYFALWRLDIRTLSSTRAGVSKGGAIATAASGPTRHRFPATLVAQAAGRRGVCRWGFAESSFGGPRRQRARGILRLRPPLLDELGGGAGAGER